MLNEIIFKAPVGLTEILRYVVYIFSFKAITVVHCVGFANED